MNADNPVNISRTLCNCREAVSTYHIPVHCRTGFFICYLNGVIYIQVLFFFSSSVRLVLQQLLGKQPHEVFKMLLTHSGWAHCLPWCVWGLDFKFLIWTKRRNRKDWSLVSRTLQETLLASEDCTHNTGCTSKKKKRRASIFAKTGAAPPVGTFAYCEERREDTGISGTVLFRTSLSLVHTCSLLPLFPLLYFLRTTGLEIDVSRKGRG